MENPSLYHQVIMWLIDQSIGLIAGAVLVGAISWYFHKGKIDGLKNDIEELNRFKNRFEGQLGNIDAPKQDSSVKKVSTSFEPTLERTGYINVDMPSSFREVLENAIGVPNATQAQLTGLKIKCTAVVEEVQLEDTRYRIMLNRDLDKARINFYITKKLAGKSLHNKLRREDRIKIYGKVEDISKFGDADWVRVEGTKIEQPIS